MSCPRHFCALGPGDAALTQPPPVNSQIDPIPLSSSCHRPLAATSCWRPGLPRRLPHLPSRCPCAKLAMSYRAVSSSASRSGRRLERDGMSTRVLGVPYPTGNESGLPLIQCPDCEMARVIKLRAKKDTINNGRTFFKCPRNAVSFSIPSYWLCNFVRKLKL